MKDKVKLGIKIVFLVFIIAWMGIVIMDYFKAKGGDNPQFCIKEEYHVYNESGNLIRDYSKKEFDALSENERKKTFAKGVGMAAGSTVSWDLEGKGFDTVTA